MKTIYLAGPDVFRENAMEHFEIVKELCIKYGFIGLSPFDNETGFNGKLFSKEHSTDVFHGNVGIIKIADIIIANLIPFRGACVDDGTAFELGYGCAHNKVLYGYTLYYNTTLFERTRMHYDMRGDTVYPNIEHFGNNVVNLMLQESIELSGGKILESFEACLIDLKAKYY